MLKKNEKYNDIEIIDNGMNFEGIAKIDGITTFIDNAITSENVDVSIQKLTHSYAKAKINKINKKSEYRKLSKCNVYDKCGGCACQHIDYNYTLKLKYNIVKNCLDKMKVKYCELNNCVGMEDPYYYRNKVQYPVRYNSKTDKTILGFYMRGSHNIVQNDICYIQDKIVDKMAKRCFDVLINLKFKGYDEPSSKGDIRHIVVRRVINTSEIIIIIVVNNQKLLMDKRFERFVNDMKEDKNIKSIFLNLNSSKNNVILSDKFKKIYGDSYITEKIEKYSYLISPKSFFQVNTIQVQKLYNILKEGLKLSKNDILFDLYSGVGSIGIYLSNAVKKVYGIEIEKQAVIMANENMRLNNIQNCEYIVGSVEDKIVEFENRNILPNVIVIDPPRKGLDDKSIEYILKFNPDKIGYVSCNPATLARDLQKLEEKYIIADITPVDMFPQTSAVENVCILIRK